VLNDVEKKAYSGFVGICRMPSLFSFAMMVFGDSFKMITNIAIFENKEKSYKLTRNFDMKIQKINKLGIINSILWIGGK